MGNCNLCDKKNVMFALADCNNFYASCERVFNPSLVGKPVVVLSNNDGCIIARSEEAKQIGIKMGVPAFYIKELIDKHKVNVFSSNYALYGDMSLRVMNTLFSIAPTIEVYSIDEAFLDLTKFPANWLPSLGEKMVEKVFKDTGIPIGVGIAPTKTLAKIANHLAKKQPGCSLKILASPEEIKESLKKIPITSIWGIGKQHAVFLEKHNIYTAYDFTKAPDNWIKKNLTVVGLRTKKELLGVSCLNMEEIPASKKAICTSRSFGKSQSELQPIEEAVSSFASKCALKLRKQKSVANQIMVFIHTNAFRKDLPQYARNRIINLPVATNSTPPLVKFARIALRSIFQKGFDYKKTGVIVLGLQNQNEVQRSLFEKPTNSRYDELMKTVDKLNSNYGNEKVRVASMGHKKEWKLRQEKLSPSYTTDLDDIITIKT